MFNSFFLSYTHSVINLVIALQKKKNMSRNYYTYNLLEMPQEFDIKTRSGNSNEINYRFLADIFDIFLLAFDIVEDCELRIVCLFELVRLKSCFCHQTIYTYQLA